MIRRVDKHTASIMSEFTGRPELNYDVYPETRRTDEMHHVMKGNEALGSSLYELQQPRAGVVPARARHVESSVRARARGRARAARAGALRALADG